MTSPAEHHPGTQPRGPLDGLRVLDFTRVLAGPHATRTLCDMGAEVIKIEPPAGDLTRFATPKVNSLSTYFVQQNTGKRNMSIDLSKAEGVQIVLDLVERSDVLIENYRPGVMDRLGLGYETLSARNPRIIHASISGYGATGPWSQRRAYASVIGAEAGITLAQGEASKGDHLTNDPFSHADLYTSLETVAAILAALHQRTRTGKGQWIDISMAETMLYVNEHLQNELYDGPVEPHWIRSFRPGEYLVLTVADGESVVVSGHPAERGTFDLFIKAMDRTDLADDARFGSVEDRLQHFGELVDEIRAFAAGVSDPETFESIFARHGLAVGAVRSARSLAESTWAAARGAIAEVSDRGDGVHRVPNPPWHFSDASVGVRGEPRYRGEDNRQVLAEVAGYDDERIDRLSADGVLSDRLP